MYRVGEAECHAEQPPSTRRQQVGNMFEIYTRASVLFVGGRDLAVARGLNLSPAIADNTPLMGTRAWYG
jgi:hypothetical protein